MSELADILGANEEALKRIMDAQPFLVDVATAKDVIPGMKDDMFLHPGPPIEWDRLCGPFKGSLTAALIFEDLATDLDSAARVAKSGRIECDSCHHHDAVNGMAGTISPSMPVLVVKEQNSGKLVFCGMQELHTQGMRHGVYKDKVQARLRWVRDTLASALQVAVRAEEIPLKPMLARAMQMGDECHSRCMANTMLLGRLVSLRLSQAQYDPKTLSEVLEYFMENEQFCLSTSMAACKATADSARGIKNSSIVTAIARNGTESGIRVSGLGDRWFTAPAPLVDGLYFPGYRKEDSAPDMGDSAITETVGLGAFCMAVSPALVRLKGVAGDPVERANQYTRDMYEITLGKNPAYQIPSLNFAGAPTGIDIMKVIETGIVPPVNTAIAHKDPGVGHIGAGIAWIPMECFKAALSAYAEEVGI